MIDIPTLEFELRYEFQGVILAALRDGHLTWPPSRNKMSNHPPASGNVTIKRDNNLLIMGLADILNWREIIK